MSASKLCPNHRVWNGIPVTNVNGYTIRKGVSKDLSVSRVLRISAMSSGSPENFGDTFGAVVVAGTFDRLHSGHKELLRRAAEVVQLNGEIVVGVTTENLLQNKEYGELIEPYDVRCNSVRTYLALLLADKGKEKDVRVDIVAISERTPPRGSSDPRLKCIVVSEETVSGAEALNEQRRRNGLEPMEVVVVNLVGEGPSKLSSSDIRRSEVGKFLRKPWMYPEDRLQRRHLSPLPYIIGLTGGIASGKSTVRNILCSKFGAASIDCDSLAHRTYLPGTPTYRAVLEIFGRNVLSPDGTIHRPTLGKAVFGNPSLMSSLTSAVWPAVRRLVAEEEEALSEEGRCQVAVVEAAMMIEATSQRHVDELWVVGVPRQLAKQRLMCRNLIGEEDAEARLNSQMSTAERMKHADVALYNDRSIDDLECQVAAAWSLLQERVSPLADRWRIQSAGQHPMWSRWLNLTARLAVPEDLTEIWWSTLQSEYGTTWRTFNWLERVQQLYRAFHRYAHFVENPSVIQLAFFFHQPPRESPFPPFPPSLSPSISPLFLRFAHQAGLPQDLVAKVNSCLGVDPESKDSLDVVLFRDFLLEILSDRIELDNFIGLWKGELGGEFGVIQGELERLLGQRTIFKTEALKEHLEERTRQNIQFLLSKIE